VGQHGERDRKLTVVSATRYAIVGQTADIVIRVDDFGTPPGGFADVMRARGRRRCRHATSCRSASDTPVKVPIRHGGENVIELIEAGPGRRNSR
jgi:hypothetical protein